MVFLCDEKLSKINALISNSRPRLDSDAGKRGQTLENNTFQIALFAFRSRKAFPSASLVG